MEKEMNDIIKKQIENNTEKSEDEINRIYDAINKTNKTSEESEIIKMVNEFSENMKKKLLNSKNINKTNWWEMTYDYLMLGIIEEYGELLKALKNKEYENVESECIDVCAFCIMIADKVNNKNKGK